MTTSKKNVYRVYIRVSSKAFYVLDVKRYWTLQLFQNNQVVQNSILKLLAQVRIHEVELCPVTNWNSFPDFPSVPNYAGLGKRERDGKTKSLQKARIHALKTWLSFPVGVNKIDWIFSDNSPHSRSSKINSSLVETISSPIGWNSLARELKFRLF